MNIATLTVPYAQTQFVGGRGYLAACTLGLPTTETIAAMRADAEDWQRGQAGAVHYGHVVERVRSGYAQLVQVDVDRVAIGSQTSVMAGVVASSVPDGAEVLCAEGDFSSMVFPFLSQAHRGVTVRQVALAELAASVTANTWLVAWSLVQSATGTRCDSNVIVTAAARHGAFTLCDTTQATGWMPVTAGLFDATICHSYKWLCAPRGVAFFTVGERLATQLAPINAGWYAGQDVWASCYGPAMRLADDARRFDVSPAWPSWVGAEPAIDLFNRLDLVEVERHATSLGDALCDGLGIKRLGQAIVSWPDAAGHDLARLTKAGLTASGRAGRARVAFHLWNDEDDVADTLRALDR
ncbi:MAG: aminotransferase class V-fold PLP-dependent enzyme [Cryobacterium sp.]|uniref:aminotransferase class V-fold PLP-dependent enzyme n=1 Tax=unclassified Cryobacterium TaxID=2649013 RepID=UPI0018C9FCBB|nr:MULTISPECIES: aminotransferase class V-fold PLP-dependent enzyme [unclassified Cryobacterium]MCY7403444.1 aminotransferase class V-fold PLP-dependent enzyme [Cryobacterium sp.]MEC5152755.1 selenocysteine lyase/cysteine desulfurase [Cryobacterium sp. CAN_C3]